jgi:D-2-hydroxyacid dehydrogenase (NADP+)
MNGAEINDFTVWDHPVTTIKLLLSTFARDNWGARIIAAVPDAKLSLVTSEDAFSGTEPCDADIAFMTREVTGRSSKNADSPELAAFQNVLRRAPRLQWLHIHPAGAERPIYVELRRRGVKVTTSSGATASTVAQSAAGALLGLARRFPALMDAQRRHAWEPLLGEKAPRDLQGQTAVIVGLGPIGRTLAAMLKVLGMSVVGVRREATPVPPCDETVTYDRLFEVLPRADWLVLACPLSPVTRGLGSAAALARLPAGAHLINVSRGDVAIEADVIDALANGRLAGAYLDVFEHEPLDSASPLWDMPNVIISPHTASHSQSLNENVFGIFLENLAHWRKGQKLRNDVDDMS